MLILSVVKSLNLILTRLKVRFLQLTITSYLMHHIVMIYCILIYKKPVCYFIIYTRVPHSISPVHAQSDTLSVCWNSVYRRIFGFNRWESVKLFIAGLGRLDLKHLILWRKICFLKGILAAGKSLLVDCLTFMKGNEWSVVLYDDLLLDASLPKYDLYRQIVAHFNTVAGFNLA